MLVYIAVAVPSLVGVGILAWQMSKVKSRLTAVESALLVKQSTKQVSKEDTVKISDLNNILNALRADESNAKSHAYSMLSKVRAEINKLGGV